MLEDVGFSTVTIHDRFDGRAVLTAHKKEILMDTRHPAFIGGRIEASLQSISCQPAETVTLAITATNTGRGRWLSPASAPEGKGAVGLFLYLTSEEDPVFGKDFPRYSIQQDLKPGDSISWEITIPAPTKPGLYNLEIDLVSEHVNFFQDTGNAPVFVQIAVREQFTPHDKTS